MQTEVTFEELQKLVKLGFTPKIETIKDKYTKITDTVTKTNTGKLITYTDGTQTKGHRLHKVLVNTSFDSWTHLEKLNVGDTLIAPDVNTVGKIVAKIEEVPEQDWIDFTVEEENHAYVQNGIIHHNSGKSVLIHYTMQLLHRTGEAKKIMVVVPNISLVGQLYNNIRDDYNYAPIVDDAYLLYGETSKEDKKAIESEHGIDRPFLITTYQSIIRKNDAWFEQFDALLIDEVHGVSSSGKSLQGISKKCFNAKYKLGYTGTLGENDADIMTTLGYVGPVTYTVKNKQLIDLGFLSAIGIKNYIVRYGEEFTAETKGLSYAAEVSKIEGNPDRNKIFKHIIDDLPVKENVLILAKHIKHMNEIEEYLTNIYNDTYIIHRIDGSVAGSTREEIREIVIANSGKCVSFDFEKFQVEINEISKITLEDESIKLAKDITIDDHINMKVLQKQYKHLIKNKLTGVKINLLSIDYIDNSHKDHLIISSFQVFAVGVNIPNLHHIIFAASYKGRIRVLQALGRGLRKALGKFRMTLHDVCDDTSDIQGTGRRVNKNALRKHYEHRLEHYRGEEFEWVEIDVNIDDLS